MSEPHQCPYLLDREARIESKLLIDVNPEELEQMIVRGWRRSGPSYFRPACHGCIECVSVRVPVATFAPTRSQRRAVRKCAGLRVAVAPPQVDEERLNLYHAWHAMREHTRGWNASALEEEDYFLQFCFPHPCAREFAYYDGSELVAIGFVDETDRALSSTYFFFHPNRAALSLGVASVLCEIQYAAERGIPHLYLGYCVPDCASLRYKAQFRPHELLFGYPEPAEEPHWLLKNLVD